MNLATAYTRARNGIDGFEVDVQVHLARGLPGLSIVGLPETSVKESKDRVRSAIVNAQFEFPVARITINLGPADLSKEGAHYDLPIAIAVLQASGQIQNEKLNHFVFIGELALSGELRAVKGILPLVLAVKNTTATVIVPNDNLAEAKLVNGINVIGARTLLDVCLLLQEGRVPEQSLLSTEFHEFKDRSPPTVIGQAQAKRALNIAAAGRHNLILFGTPGAGKTMLANRLVDLLPPLSEQQALENAAIRSVLNGQLCMQSWRQVPFVSPHHTSSGVALVGGGRPPKPGAVSLAHHGILFLDELLEFARKDLEVLREPLESLKISIVRASHQCTYPADFQLVAALNPCPCGYWGDKSRACRCSPDQIRRYLTKLSGPLLDRIDLHVEVLAVEKTAFFKQEKSHENLDEQRERIEVAMARQHSRNKGEFNSRFRTSDPFRSFLVAEEARVFLEKAVTKLNFSMRVLNRLVRLARTIADLDDLESVQATHFAEALNYRKLESYLEKL